MLGEAVTPDVAAAWDEVYWLFAAQLIAAEARIYAQTGVDPAQVCAPTAWSARSRRPPMSPPSCSNPPTASPCRRPLQASTCRCSWTCPTVAAKARQYTVSSTALGTRLQITVRRVRGVDGAPDGEVSTFLHDPSRWATWST